MTIIKLPRQFNRLEKFSNKKPLIVKTINGLLLQIELHTEHPKYFLIKIFTELLKSFFLSS